MYPYLRLAKTLLAPVRDPIDIYEVHRDPMICWPQDIDMFMEMNNGRVQTLYDLGRFRLSKRAGFLRVLKDNRWGLAVAGSSTRYRKRITLFQRYEMRTRFLGYDDRFMYLEQGMWRGETCHNHALLRTAVLGKSGTVAPREVALAMNHPEDPPALPDWVTNWTRAEATRDWPPAL